MSHRPHSSHFTPGIHLAALLIACAAIATTRASAQGSAVAGLLTSRTALTSAEAALSRSPNPGDTERNAVLAAAIRQRLRDGDFQVGDRVIVSITSDAVHTDTAVVRAGRFLDLPGKITVPLTGVLRSEVQERVTTEVLKYIKAQQVEVTPLVRIGVLGEVAHPGYFAFTSDRPLSDAIMGAGGPTATADLGQSIIRRRGQEFRSSGETRQAIAGGVTLDQFGLAAGDELVIGRQRGDLIPGSFLALTGVAVSVLTAYIALHARR